MKCLVILRPNPARGSSHGHMKGAIGRSYDDKSTRCQEIPSLLQHDRWISDGFEHIDQGHDVKMLDPFTTLHRVRRKNRYAFVRRAQCRLFRQFDP